MTNSSFWPPSKKNPTNTTYFTAHRCSASRMGGQRQIKDTGILLEPQRLHMDELYEILNLAGLTNRINEIQQHLIHVAAAKTNSQSPHAA